MANRGVCGYVIDTDNNPARGLTVIVYDVESIARDEPLGKATTALDGHFGIFYDPSAYGWLEETPDLRVRVYDQVKRLVYESPEYEDVPEEIFFMTIHIPTLDLRGWLVTLRTGTHHMLSENNYAEILIDNKVAWKRMTDMVAKAQSNVHFTQLIFDIPGLFRWDKPRLFTVFDPENPQEGKKTTGKRLENVLLNVNLEKGVEVRLLLNDVDIVQYPFDTVDHVERYYETAKEVITHTVKVRGFLTDYNKALHLKNLIIDGKAACIIGSPLFQEYFDDTTHLIDDPRRGAMSKQRGNLIKVPIHDVSLYLEGQAVEHLNQTFALLWRQAGGTVPDPPSVLPPTSPPPNTSIQIVRTLPGELFPDMSEGETGILEAYQRAICNAEDFIYLENQYFTEPLIADALALALEAKPQLKVIMVVNNAVDVIKYHRLQSRLLADLNKHFPDRFGAFTLWTHETSDQGDRIIRNYVHSKVGIVDDKWATVGSANLDGQGLNYSQHIWFGNICPVKWMITQHDVVTERAIEVNAVFFNGVDGQPPSTIPGELRRRLWAEHLGFSPDDDILREQYSGGWLQLWKDRAQQKFDSLNAIPPTLHESRILEWNKEEDPMEYLQLLGVTPVNLLSETFTVEKSVRSFNLFTGEWVV